VSELQALKKKGNSVVRGIYFRRTGGKGGGGSGARDHVGIRNGRFGRACQQGEWGGGGRTETGCGGPQPLRLFPSHSESREGKWIGATRGIAGGTRVHDAERTEESRTPGKPGIVLSLRT